MAFPDHAEFVIIGAGIHGLSTAWQLAKRFQETGKEIDGRIIVLDKTGIASGASGTIISSEDGSTWNSGDSGTSNHLINVDYLNGTFFIVGYSGTILSSTDGYSWTPRISGTSNVLRMTSFADDIFVSVGNSGEVVTSSDGISWAKSSSGSSSTFEGITNNKVYSPELEYLGNDQ